jgi:predicted MFS family arabinose efflux permease
MADHRPVSPRRLTALISSLIFLDMITWLAAVPLVPVWQDEFGLTDDQSGVILGIYSFAVLLFAIPAGHLADRLGARRLSLIGAAVFIVAAPAIALADTFWLLLLVRVVQGACSAVTWSAGLAWLGGAVGDDYRPRGLSIANATATVGTIAGPLLGGPIVAAVGIGVAFSVLGGLVALVVLWALFEPGGDPHAPTHHDAHGPFESLRRARKPGRIQIGFVAIGFVALMMAALQLLGPLHMDAAGLSSSTIGWIFTVGSVFSVLSILVVARLGRRLNQTRALVVLPPICGTLVVLMLLPFGIPWYAALLIIVMCLASPIFTISYAACADGARDERIGEGGVFGMLNAVWAIGSLLAPIIAGFISQQGPSWLMYALVGLVSVIAMIALRRSEGVVTAAARAGYDPVS